MENRTYISPRIVTVAFLVDQGYYGSVKNSTQNLDEVFIRFNNNNDQGRFGNDQLSTLGDNYNFFGD